MIYSVHYGSFYSVHYRSLLGVLKHTCYTDPVPVQSEARPGAVRTRARHQEPNPLPSLRPSTVNSNVVQSSQDIPCLRERVEVPVEITEYHSSLQSTLNRCLRIFVKGESP